MLSLGRSHRLSLLDRLDRIEQRGVTWTQEEVDGCLTMEQFLDPGSSDPRTTTTSNDETLETPSAATKAPGAPPPESILWDALLYRTEFFDIAYYHRCRAASRP